MRRVVVTGLGTVNPLGLGVLRSWNELLSGRSGIVSLLKLSPAYSRAPSQVAALVPKGTEPHQWNSRDRVSPKDERRMALFSQYAVVAAEQALADAHWSPKEEIQLERTGVCIGSGIGNLEDMYSTSVTFEKGEKKVSALFVPRILINLAAGHVCMRHGFKGPNHAASTACTTGAHSIGDASRFIAFGDADVMVAGGSEACIHPLALDGFSRARCLATDWNDNPKLASRPFDRDRAGFVIGEGAAMMVLEELEHAKRRGARIYAELKGYGVSSDAYHITAPLPNGHGAFLAMKRCLENSSLQPERIDYINAHATSTTLGDATENLAIKNLFLGPFGRSSAPSINVSSVKGAIGHLLGAAGAVEALFTVLSVHNDVLPPTLNLDKPGEPLSDFDCNYVPHTAQSKVVRAAISNSFGFGGTNASLCFAKLE